MKDNKTKSIHIICMIAKQILNVYIVLKPQSKKYLVKLSLDEIFKEEYLCISAFD